MVNIGQIFPSEPQGKEGLLTCRKGSYLSMFTLCTTLLSVGTSVDRPPPIKQNNIIVAVTPAVSKTV